MKNQNDLIVLIVTFVLALGITLTAFFMKREPSSPQAPPQVITSEPALPVVAVTMANALPGGSSQNGGVGGGSNSGGGPIGGPGGGPRDAGGRPSGKGSLQVGGVGGMTPGGADGSSAPK